VRFTYEDWLADLEQVPASERAEFIRLSLRSKSMLHVFGRYFFPEEIPQGEDLAGVHYDLIRDFSSPKNTVEIVPRGHAKTTWARIDVLHDVVYQHEAFIVFCGPTMTDAGASLGYVKTQLENNPLLHDVYGYMVPPFDPRHRVKWTDTHFEANGIIVMARGAGKGRGLNIRGKRPTKIIIDDIEDQEKVKVQLQREKLEQWVTKVLIPALDPKRGKLKMLGTVLHYDCLLLKMYAKYGGVRRAALEDNEGKPSLDGSPIWPSRFSKEKLRSILEDIGTFAFAQEYLNDPMTDENADVKLKWIQRIGDIRLVDEQDKPLWRVYSVLDPAVSEKQTADESAICTVAAKIKTHADQDLEIVVLGIEHGNWGITRSVQKANQVHTRYKHEKFGCENVAFQEGLRQVLNENSVPAVAVNPKSKDKRSRLLNIVGLIEFGKIKFMDRVCEDLITQLVQFPNADRDDMVDAFVYAVEMARGSGGGFMAVRV